MASRRSRLGRPEKFSGLRKPCNPLEDVLDVLYDGRGYFWIGVYFVIGERVVRQAFRGPIAPCHSFAFGQGNVGTTGERGLIKVIPNVADDPTYSLCFLETKSEIVVPIRIGARTLGVIDVESDRVNAFGPQDQALLKTLAKSLARFLTSNGRYLVRKAREAEAARAQVETLRATSLQSEEAPRSGPQAEKPAGRRAAAGETPTA